MVSPNRRLWPLFVVFLCAPASAQFTVTNTADSGAGSLRAAITSSNLLAGSNNISWGIGSGGTLTLLSDLPAIAAGTTLDVSNAPSAVTIGGAFNVPIAGAATFWTTSASQPWTISSTISGAGTLTQGGGGSLFLNAANTYGGGTVFFGGATRIASIASLGTGDLTFAGGTLQTASAIVTSKNLTMAGAGNIDTLGYGVTLNGVISGGGPLSILSTGTVTLAGNNYAWSGGLSFTTGAVVIANTSALGTGTLSTTSGTLKLGVDVNLPNSFAIYGTSLTLDTQGHAFISSNSIGGAGGLTILGNGPVTLTAGSTYGGGTVFGAGIINVQDGSALGSGIVTFNGGTLQTGTTVTLGNSLALTGNATIDTQGNASTLSGIISGAGSLTTISTGTLFLTAVNTYTGGTNLNNGWLNINNSWALGTSSLTISGGSLQFTGGFSLPIVLALGAAGGTIDTSSSSIILSQPIIGGAGGSLTKTGVGTLFLDAVSAYNGATIVNGGTLQMGIDYALPAGTALSVNNGAFVDLQSSTQTVASLNVSPPVAGATGGGLKMVLRQVGNNLTVNGNANLTNGTLSVALPGGAIATQGQKFNPITAVMFTGTNTVTIQSPAALSFTPAVVAGGVANVLQLTTNLVPFASLAASPNQAQIGNALEPLRANPTGDAATILGALYAMNGDDLRAALNQIGPMSLSAMKGVGLAGSSVQSAAVAQRMSVLADGGAHPGFEKYQVNARSEYPGTLVAEAGAGDELYEPAKEKDSKSPWGFFSAAVYNTGRLNHSSNDPDAQPGYDFNSGGLTAGADYRLDEHFVGGASLGYLKGHSSVTFPGSGTVDDTSVHLGVYGAGNGDKLHANLYIGGAVDTFATRRGINFGVVSRTAGASPTGTEFNMNSSLSYDLRHPEYGIFSPFGALDYHRLMIGGFTETGADTLDLSVGPQTAESLQSTLGLRYSKRLRTEKREWVPYASLGWRHEFDDQSRPISARFATGVGNPFSVNTGGFARDGSYVGTGIAASVGKYSTLRLDYSGDFRSKFQSSTINLSLRLKF